MTTKKDGQIAEILEVSITSRRRSQVLRLVREWVKAGEGANKQKRLIFTPNSEMLVEASKNPEFKEVLNGADLNIPDGSGLVLANWFLKSIRHEGSGQTISSRLTGTDMVVELTRQAYLRGWRVMLLGGWERVAERTAGRLVKQFEHEGYKSHPKFEIRWESGVKDVKKASGSKKGVMVRKVNEFKPDLLFVSFGPVRQETWLSNNREKMEFNVAMGVGGAFDYLSGKVTRAPLFIRKIGFEWLFRLVVEPWRWRRQLRLGEFVELVVREGLRL